MRLMGKILAPALAACILLSGCAGAGTGGTSAAGAEASASAAAGSAKVKKLTAAEAHDRMTSGDPVVILDVRTAEEYAAAHIEGAILLPNEQIGDTAPAALPVKDAELLIYCRSGNRSAQAAKKLTGLGYTNVNDFGGINDWTFGTVSGAWEEKAGTLASFRTSDLFGTPVDESIFSGAKLTMLNVWATFCGPCIQEMPELGELNKAYKSRGVQVVGFVADAADGDGFVYMSQVQTARKLVSQTGADYRHLLPSSDLYTAPTVQVSAVPTTFFIDSKGNVVGEPYVGSRSGSSWAAIIDGLLAEQGA